MAVNRNPHKYYILMGHKKIIPCFLLVFLFSFSVQLAFAQTTQAEINKMIKDANAEIEKMKKDPANKDLFKGIPNLDSMMNNVIGKKPTGPETTIRDSSAFSVPSRNNKLLNSLPIRTFNKAELISYLHNLNIKLTELLGAKYGISFKNIPVTETIKTGTSIWFWLNGELEVSLLVALKGAEINPDNATLLNNVGGILIACGLSVNAIPILQFVLEKQAANNMVLNNLGQAYFDLGDDKKAEQYLMKCVSSYKYYPDANLALAYIYESRGNKSAALNFVENSLRGAWSSTANTLLRKLKPDANMMDYVKHRYKQPEYFNFNKYKMLPQCRRVEDVYMLESQYVAYQKMLHQLLDKYSNLYGSSGKLLTESVPKELNDVAKKKRTPYRPFGTFAGYVSGAIKTEYDEKIRQFRLYKENYYNERKEIDKKYGIELKKIDQIPNLSKEEKCRKINGLTNIYLPLYADQTESLQQKLLPYYKNYFNDASYWSYIASINNDEFHHEFLLLVVEFLSMLQEVNTTRFMEPGFDHSGGGFYPCEFDVSVIVKADSLLIEDPDCFLGPVKLVLPLGSLKLEISCESYKLEAGQIWIGKLEYDRKSGEATIAFGLGGSIPEVMFKGLGVEAGLEAEVKSQFYITFDKTGPTDLGVLWESELKFVAGIGETKAEVTLGGDELKAGFGNGVTMKEGGPLKALIDKTWYVQPDDKQQNKNVPLYKNSISKPKQG